jgi:hypothetical protein
MGIYKKSDQLYDILTRLFERLLRDHPAATQTVSESRLLIRLRCYDPPAHILINGRRNPATVTFGANRVRPELDVELSGDTLHFIMLGELTVPKALSGKLLKVRGPAWKTLTLVNLFQNCREIYPQITSDMGLPET